MGFAGEARAYCQNRVEWLAIKRAMAATPCEYLHDYDSQVCWTALEQGDISDDECCEACAGNTHHRKRRAELGKRMPNLMKRMLRAYRESADEEA